MAKMAAPEREIYPHPGGKTMSDVWKFFGFYKIQDDEPPLKKNLDLSQAICRVCRKIYKNTGESNVKNHSLKLPSIFFRLQMTEELSLNYP